MKQKGILYLDSGSVSKVCHSEYIKTKCFASNQGLNILPTNLEEE